tara:strand:+ start:10205 stop:11278 length:1074 start_codon:yes stop_codon:yes gene_type:complete
MKFFKIISAAFLVSCAPQGQGKDAGKVSASNSSSEDNNNQDLIMSDLLTAFWNVENLFDFEDDAKTRDNDFLPDGKYNWTESKYYQKLDRIAQVMNDFGDELPHLMGLVEVENFKVLEDLVKHDDIRKAGYKILHKESKDQRGIDVAVLYNPNYLSLIEFEFLDIDSHSDKSLFSRDILYAGFKQADGSVLHSFTNHWPSRRNGWKETEHKRLAAAKTLKSKLNDIKLTNPDAQILISGDFNDYPDNKSLFEVIGAKSIKDKSADLINLAFELDKDNLGTITYDGDWGMFDMFIVSKSLLNKTSWDVKKSEMKIFKEDYLLYYDKKHQQNQPSRFQGNRFYGGYSDHLAIYLHLEKK